MADTYNVSIKGPGVDLSKEVEEPLAQRLIVAVITGKMDPATAQSRETSHHQAGDAVAQEHDDNADSMANFVTASEATKVPQKIAAIGLFLKKYRGEATFTRDSLAKGFTEAADSVPKNLARDLKTTVRAGWIAAKPGAKGEFYVTVTGSKVVGEHFAGATKPLRRRAKGKKAKDQAKS